MNLEGERVKVMSGPVQTLLDDDTVCRRDSSADPAGSSSCPCPCPWVWFCVWARALGLAVPAVGERDGERARGDEGEDGDDGDAAAAPSAARGEAPSRTTTPPSVMRCCIAATCSATASGASGWWWCCAGGELLLLRAVRGEPLPLRCPDCCC